MEILLLTLFGFIFLTIGLVLLALFALAVYVVLTGDWLERITFSWLLLFMIAMVVIQIYMAINTFPK